VDRSEAVHDVSEAPAYVGAIADVADPDALGRALATTVEAFGGLDIVVHAAGVFPKSAYLDGQNRENWERAMAVNATAVHELFARAHPFLADSPFGGRVVLIASKNAVAP